MSSSRPLRHRRAAARAAAAGLVAALLTTAWVPVAGADGLDPADPGVQSDPSVPPSDGDPGAQIPEAGPTTAAEVGTSAIIIKAPPTKVLPLALDAMPGWQPSVSCDPNDKPGILLFAALVSEHWGMYRYHTSRQCVLGDGTQHAEGRALDWTMNAYDPTQKALGDAVVAWLTADSGAMARRFGIMYLIWNRQIWYAYRPAVFEAYTGPVPHTDHIHFSFTWDGAMGRTSWWTGVPVAVSDVGTCRVYDGQYAPRYVDKRTTACPSGLPDAPFSAYPVTLPGATGSAVSLAQGLLGVPADGSFGTTTLTALLAYQAAEGIPVTGVLDNATWASLVTTMPVPPFAQLVGAPDLTGDGWGDLAAVDDEGRLSVFPGEKGGVLGAPRVFGTGWADLTVYAPGDWNGDRRGDLVTVDAAGDLWLYAGDAAGRFPRRTKIGNGWSGYRITPAGDVSGDRVADLLAIDPDGKLWLYPGNGKGGFGNRLQVGNGWSAFQLYAAGDQNRDGRADVLGIDATGRLWFYAGRGGGYFAQRVQVGNGWNGYLFASGADLNRDGIGDLVGRDSAGTVWFYAGRVGLGFWAKRQLAEGW